MRVVSDTTTLIAFLGLDRLSILKELFGKLAIPKAVYDELHQKTVPLPEEWAEVIEIKDRRSYRSYRRILGAGESEALCLCRQIGLIPAVHPEIERLEREVRFRIAPGLREEVLRTAGELPQGGEP